MRYTGASRSNRRQLTLHRRTHAQPVASTDLVFDNDLTFEGVTANYRIALQRDELFNRFVFLTLGGFPIEEFEINSEDKWLFGGQLGMEYRLDCGSRLRLAGAYYDYREHGRPAQRARQQSARLHGAQVPAARQHAVRHPQRCRCDDQPVRARGRIPADRRQRRVRLAPVAQLPHRVQRRTT